MPYIITTKTKASPDPVVPLQVASRRAVATLDKARAVAHGIVMRAPQGRPEQYTSHYGRDAYTLPDHGGTMGPLPDGTVIEVETATWDELADDAGTPLYPAVVSHSEIIDAYNEAQKH